MSLSSFSFSRSNSVISFVFFSAISLVSCGSIITIDLQAFIYGIVNFRMHLNM